MTNIGENIKELRLKQKMTQEKLAQLLNVTVSAVSQWESGKTLPDIAMLVPICNIFSVSSDKLLNIRIEEKGSIIAETKNRIFSLMENGDYDSAIELIKKQMADYPNEVEYTVLFAQVVMSFDKNVEGHIEQKEDLCAELFDLVITKESLSKWKDKESYNHDLDMEIIIFVTQSIIARNSSSNARKLRARMDNLLSARYTQQIKKELLEIADNSREVCGTQNRLMGYEALVELIKRDWQEYEKSKDKELLKEMVAFGEEFIQNNSTLDLYIKTFDYLIKALNEQESDSSKYYRMLSDVRDNIEQIIE